MTWVILLISFFLYLLLGPGQAHGVILNYRLFRGIFAIISGAYLSVSGVLLQAVFNNPLVEPYILGVSAGASTGALVSIYLLGLSAPLWVSGFSFASAVVCVGLVFALSVNLHPSKETLLLVGLSAGAFLTAINSILMLVKSHNPTSDIVFWLLGSLAGAGLRQVEILLGALPLLILSILFSRRLDLLLWGKEAETMGLTLWKTRAGALAISTVLTALVVSQVGVIGFVGLISPHIARKIWGYPHRKLLPGAVAIGGIVLLLSDLLSRVLLSPWEIPVGLITALVGAPLFLYLTLRKSL